LTIICVKNEKKKHSKKILAIPFFDVEVPLEEEEEKASTINKVEVN
jgi:hypothetical protein